MDIQMTGANMKRLLYLAMLSALAASCDAVAVGSIADGRIVDRPSGAELSAHYYHGEYWVAGRPGATYAIEIHNRLGERVLAVTSVDGVNVISGATAGWDQGGYVFSPGERYQITGWRKTDAEVAEFTFTDSSNSYAQRTGRPANVGVIGVAVFRERQTLTSNGPQTIGQSPYPPVPSPAADSQVDSAARESKSVTQGSAASPATTSSLSLTAPMSVTKLGTGHGEREYSYVIHTEFSRSQTQPNEVIRIRYDSLDNLIAMGIVKRSHVAAPTADPFPDSSARQYVPDPEG
jgi:hypothetical protein